MFALFPVLAEFGDKVPGLLVLFLWSAAIALLAWALIRKKKWLAILPIGLAALFAVGATAEARDRFISPAIVRESGYGYVAFTYSAAALPLFPITAFLLRKMKGDNYSAPSFPPLTG